MDGYELIHLEGTLLLKKKKLIGNKLQTIKYFLNEEQCKISYEK
jgi:hypothetical protein